MIKRWFKDLFIITRRVSNDTFSTEPFNEVGRTKGFMQPVTGRLSQSSGKETAEKTYLLYCPIEADIEVGDRIIDKYGVTWSAQYEQHDGISGKRDHQEVILELLP